MVVGRFSSYLLQSRLYFAFFPVLALLAGAGYLALKGDLVPGVRLGRIAAVLVLLVMAFNVFELGVQVSRMGAPQAFLGLRSDADYLADNLGAYAAAMQAVRDLPAGSRTLLVFEPRSLYCRPGCTPDDVLDLWMRSRYPSAEDALPLPNEEILAGWRQAGYTHLLYYRLGADFIRDEGRMPYAAGDWQALEDLTAQLAPVQDFVTAYTLYSLEPER
jgi:hypothetical protein